MSVPNRNIATQNPLERILTEILVFLKIESAKQTRAYMRGLRISKDYIADLKDLGNGDGIVDLTIRNAGEQILVIDDGTSEEVLPGETFTDNGNHPVCNEKLKLVFKKDPAGGAIQKKDAIIRWHILKCD